MSRYCREHEAMPDPGCGFSDEEWCDFAGLLWEKLDRTDEDGKTRWACGEGDDRWFYTKQVAIELGIEDPQEFADVWASVWCCECEVMLNAPCGDEDKDEESA